MATLTPTLTLVSTDATTDSLSISVTDSLTVTEPTVAAARVSVATGTPTVLVADAGTAGTVYVYVKNTDTNFVSIKNDAGNLLGKLNAGEFCFIPVDTNTGGGLEVQADTAACIVEYATFTKS